MPDEPAAEKRRQSLKEDRMTFVARHGPYDAPPGEVYEMCADCGAIIMDSAGQSWLGNWELAED